MSDTMQEIADREILRYAVQREIFCPATGKVLDITDSVLLMGDGIRPRVISAEIWDDIGSVALEGCADAGLTPEVYDGRVLFEGAR